MVSIVAEAFKVCSPRGSLYRHAGGLLPLTPSEMGLSSGPAWFRTIYAGWLELYMQDGLIEAMWKLEN